MATTSRIQPSFLYKENEALAEVTNTSSCANCLKVCRDGGEKHLICSACRGAAYCCKACQKEHWKEHKPRCKARQEAKRTAKEQGNGREFRLLQNWKEKVRNGTMEMACVSLFGFETLQNLGREEVIVVWTIEFNYNKRTFLPVKEPELVPLSLFEEINPQGASNMRQAYKEMEQDTRVANHANFLILLTVKGSSQNTGNILPVSLEAPDSPVTKTSWKDHMLVLSQIRLQSTIFDSWMPQMTNNMKQQLQVVRYNPHFQPFLVNALRIETASATRHKTHIVVLFVEMGPGLGQVVKVQDYDIKTVQQVQSIFQSYLATGLVNQPTLDHYNTHMFDLEHSPSLLETRQRYPNNALLPVLCVAKGEAILVLPNYIEISPHHPNNSPTKCDKKARAAFEQLTRIKFPPVDSPELK